MLLVGWALLATAATVILLGHQVEIFVAPDDLLTVAIVGLAVEAFAPVARRALLRARGKITSQVTANTKMTLNNVVLELNKNGLGFYEVGASAFLVQRHIRMPWRPYLGADSTPALCKLSWPFAHPLV